jgi:hypothetical protein
MVAKNKTLINNRKKILTFDESRLDRLIIEFRKIVPAVKGRRVTEVILFSPSGHMDDKIGFLL